MFAKTKIKILDKFNQEHFYEIGEVIKEKINQAELQRLIDIGAIEDDNILSETEEIVFLTEEDLKRMQSKQKIVEYANSIGLELNIELKKDDLISNIIVYTDEMLNKEGLL